MPANVRTVVVMRLWISALLRNLGAPSVHFEFRKLTSEVTRKLSNKRLQDDMNRVAPCLTTGEAGLFAGRSAVEPCCCRKDEGLTLIETLIAILILSSGLLAAAQLIYVAMASASLARMKISATVVADDRLEFLADLYRQNPAAAELAQGIHGPQLAEVMNPTDGAVLNRYNVSWLVGALSDPRPGKILPAARVEVTVAPANAKGGPNTWKFFNGTVTVTAIFSAVTR